MGYRNSEPECPKCGDSSGVVESPHENSYYCFDCSYEFDPPKWVTITAQFRVRSDNEYDATRFIEQLDNTDVDGLVAVRVSDVGVEEDEKDSW